MCAPSQADRGFTLKVMGKKKVFDSKRSKKVMSEIALLGALTPSVWTPTLLAAFSDKRHLFSVFDKVLAAEMVSIVDGPMPEAATKFFIGSVALGLSHIHTHEMVYRSLSLDSLWLSTKGYPQLTEFSIAKSIAETGRTYTLCGTPDYLAPEQVSTT